jgi:hypothetical protein
VRIAFSGQDLNPEPAVKFPVVAGPRTVCVPFCLTGPAVETELSQEAALELRVEAG